MVEQRDLEGVMVQNKRQSWHQRWDSFFPLCPFASSFDSNATEGPVLHRELSHGYEHVLISQHLKKSPSLGKSGELENTQQPRDGLSLAGLPNDTREENETKQNAKMLSLEE